MRFKIDQNLTASCAVLLQQEGHDAMTVYDQSLDGHPDDEIVSVCQAEMRVLITADLDLSDIRAYPPGESPGFIVLRLKRQSEAAQLALLRSILPSFKTQLITGRLWVVEPGRVRIRGGEPQ